MSNAYLINTQTMEWPIYEGDYRLSNPNKSFSNPLIPEAPFEWVVQSDAPQYDAVTKGIREIQPQRKQNQWIRTWEVYDLTPEQILNNQEQLKQTNKQKAEGLLRDSDWATIPSVSDPSVSNPYLSNSADFFNYRNQLRAIAINPPDTVEQWPVKPQEVWSS